MPSGPPVVVQPVGAKLPDRGFFTTQETVDNLNETLNGAMFHKAELDESGSVVMIFKFKKGKELIKFKTGY
jgi:hypothetical protein